ncbi:hypothetical protein [uncultured Thiodictyon sp.]|uniref:hypothetical protein n=1 Tax=uncultured Thiodictyon sp. TaxID=1846217 RepID=UPI0025F871D6|nr:hypothetical protein [uncultured Thiodictyon sp.]
MPFFSEHYAKPWCAMEWETIRGILLTRRAEDAVIPVHLDDTEIPGWPAVGVGIKPKGRTDRGTDPGCLPAASSGTVTEFA